MIIKNNKYQKEWHNATKPLNFSRSGTVASLLPGVKRKQKSL
jgi:hypothetical protein